MRSPAHYFSVIFIIISSVSALLGANVLLAKRKNKLHYVFFAISMCLSVWALGFAIAISAPTEQVCLFWRRIAAIGWSVIFSAILHFTLVITKSKLARKKWLITSLYLPSALSVFIFAIFDFSVNNQYRLVNMPYGWTNVEVNNGWDIFYYAYILTYILASLVLLWNWHRTARNDNEKRQARVLLLSFGAAVFLGMLTDLVNSSFLLLKIPQMAPIAFLIPLFAIQYSMRKHRFLNTHPVDDDTNILTDTTRKKVLGFISYGFAAGGILFFLAEYVMDGSPFLSAFIVSVSLFILGAVFFILQWVNIKNGFIEYLFLTSSMVAIPVVTFWFVQSASVTIWAFPFVFIIISMLFNNGILLLGSAISIFLTELAVWVITPGATVNISGSDYVVRFGILTITMTIAFYVNKAYVRRLQDNVRKNRYQSLISEVSTIFVSTSEANKMDNVGRMLEKASACFQADCAFLYLRKGSSSAESMLYTWDSGVGVKARDLPLQPSCISFAPLTNNPFVIQDTAGECSECLDAFKPLLPGGRSASFLSLPLNCSGSYSGFLGLSTVQTMRKWYPDQVDTLRIMTNTISHSLTRLSAEQQMQFMAFHDPETGLPNRLLFFETAQKAICAAKQKNEQIGFVFLDVDFFKSINDTIGHRVADLLMKEVSSRLQSCVQACDMVARFGGDVFIIMLNSVTRKADLSRFGSALMELFEKPFSLQGQEFFITASAGIAVFPLDGEDAGTLVTNADIAKYSAKERGRSQFLFCSEDMKGEVQYKVRLTNNLYRALERSELRVYYQPQVNLQTNRVIGAEALLRWFHPELGLIPPGVFIPLAEKTGIINSIGEWVLRESCRQIRQWRDKSLPLIRVAVNISASQLRNYQFVDIVRNILAETGVDPHMLELELTESAAIKESEYIVSVLESLKKLGISIAIDDFGTEYSSLNRLKQLPADRIKMDMQFVQGIDKNEKDKAIAKIIINLAKSLGMKVIAEGVENHRQLTFLRERFCDEVQGFLYYKPMPAEDFECVLAEQSAADAIS